MALLSSGSMSLGGSVEGRSINLELRRNATSTIDLNDGEARYLANVPSGNISVSDFYGKQYYTFGQQEFTLPGAYEWECPDAVTSVSVVCVGGGGGGDAGSDLIGVGGGGAGGAVAYRNNIEVIPGQTYTIIVGQGGAGQITVNGTTTATSSAGEASSAFSCIANGGAKGVRSEGDIGIQSFSAAGGLPGGVNDGGGTGGIGGSVDTTVNGFRVPGGGGAAGYSDIGGKGANGSRPPGSPASATGLPGASGQGGGGGGGGAGFSSEIIRENTGGNGGGVGIYGQGTSGPGGSGGSASIPASDGTPGSSPGNYGAGGSGGIGGDNRQARPGIPGAVRIIWPGNIRRFPNIQTQNA